MPVALSQVISTPDVLFADHFDLKFPRLPSGVPNNSRELNVRNIRASLPGRELERASVEAHRHKINFAGKVQYDQTFTATFFEAADEAIFDTLLSWQQAIIDPTTGLPRGLKANYAVDAFCQLYDSDNAPKQKRVYKNLWCQKVDSTELDGGGGSNIIRVSATFVYDVWLPG